MSYKSPPAFYKVSNWLGKIWKDKSSFKKNIETNDPYLNVKFENFRRFLDQNPGERGKEWQNDRYS